MKSSSSRYGLFVVASLILVMAGVVWNLRAQRANLVRAQTANRHETQHAVSLLIRAFLADTQLTYSALSQTTALYAGKEMKTQALLTRTPRAMAISYLNGDRQGLQTGYNGRWFWRSAPGSGMRAHAEVMQEAPAMMARRLSLMLDNYTIEWKNSGIDEGRAVEILEIRPSRDIDGARGPGKILTIDSETGLTVSTRTFDYNWQMVMQSKLSKIDFTPTITAKTFASPQEMSQAAKTKPWLAQDMGHNDAEVAQMTGFQPPTPTYVPPGFMMDGVGVHRCNENGTGPMAAFTRYTDGLNVLTVFAMPEPEVDTMTAPEQICDFGSGTLISAKTPNGYAIVVSDLPPATLRRVVDSTKVVMK